MDGLAAMLERSGQAWLPVRSGESGARIFRRTDGFAHAKAVPPDRADELAGERDRLAWLGGRGIRAPEVVGWRETEHGAWLEMTTIPGVPVAALGGEALLAAWPIMLEQLASLHALPVDECPFDRGLARMAERAADVVKRQAVNPDFLPDEDRAIPAERLLARIEAELPARLEQEALDRVVCHGDPCLPNLMIDPATSRCTGVIDLGRLGRADRHADLALLLANAGESWTSPEQASRAFDLLSSAPGIGPPDRERLAFYLRLDPLTWG
ncbi:APH(3'') family aminoglycoside O-phosphotransferase [Roseomonas terrae]|uniref:Aminoglycoside 3'-phosphotransferase n=1 Tax=Neoroseomonas terrae TaxID=424799 RepID=A0ABS5EP35_9PROT|nr:APH(3'') family aminoglycoside O-phosphotransferase [Neoroseomonas terrae]MBR0652804.1 APH(3'') family aminoglycoside O-phosphotransferase [Neoroseomonas terrae]